MRIKNHRIEDQKSFYDFWSSFFILVVYNLSKVNPIDISGV